MKAFVCRLLVQYDIGLPVGDSKTDLDSTHRKDTWVPISDVQVTLSPIQNV